MFCFIDHAVTTTLITVPPLARRKTHLGFIPFVFTQPSQPYVWCKMHQSVAMFPFRSLPALLHGNEVTEMRNGLYKDVLKANLKVPSTICAFYNKWMLFRWICLQICILWWIMLSMLFHWMLWNVIVFNLSCRNKCVLFTVLLKSSNPRSKQQN